MAAAVGGAGAHGPRDYDWAQILLAIEECFQQAKNEAGRRDVTAFAQGQFRNNG
jgi:hypothetical protein